MHCASLFLSTLLTLAKVGIAVPASVAHATPVESTTSLAQHDQPETWPVPIILPRASTRQNIDNTCGNRNGQTLKCNSQSPGGGPCCSQYGFCGTGPLYCGDGCQSDFGQCDFKVASHRPKHCGPKHKSSKCSAGECCSANGRCGRSEAFCGKHCQPEFGACHNKNDPKPKPTPDQKPDSKDHPKRCGKAFDNIKCTNGECCSANGYCGKGHEYCTVPQDCQRGFGLCDSDAAPKGFDVSAMAQPRPQLGKVPYGQEIRKCTRPKTLALSFDDGPSNNTMRILDVLRDHKAKATFFISGNTNGKGMIDETAVWIEAIKRIISEGHQIGSHTWSHPHLNDVTRDVRLLDMARNDRAIANIVGQFPTYMRPPYIECSKESGCLQDMADMGYHVFGWDVDSLDWHVETTLDQMKSNIDKSLNERKADDNMFLIQHDHNQHAVELTIYVLEQAQKKQWRAVTLGECMNDPTDFWYHEPTWIDMNTIATSGNQHGCVVAAPGFCGNMVPFKDKSTCNHAASVCQKLVHDCKKKLGEHNLACNKYDKICGHQKVHCKKCGSKNYPSCDSANWSFNRLME